MLMGRQFEIQDALDGVAQHPDVAVLDVPTVLSQVDGDAIGPTEFR